MVYGLPTLLNDDANNSYSDADWAIDEFTVERLAAAMPESTRRAYNLVARDFSAWCAAEGRVPLPATKATLTAFVSHLITNRRAPASVSQYIGGIRSLHILDGYKGQPETDDALALLRSYRRQRAREGYRQREAPPLLVNDLKRCVAAMDLTKNQGRRDQLLLVLGFSLMARRSELQRLTLDDVTQTEEGAVIRIATSKCDRESVGEHVAIPRGSTPSIDCVTLLQQWCELLAEHGHTEGPLLRRVTRLDAFSDDGICDRTISEIVRRSAIRAALPNAERYTAHSLRAGGLTSALQAGVPLGIAARHGRWSEASPVVIKYARAADRFRDNAMKKLL